MEKSKFEKIPGFPGKAKDISELAKQLRVIDEKHGRKNENGTDITLQIEALEHFV